ncbi:D-alanyl-D-alanine carboxypeptidase [Arenibacter sp. GZD96]|uniref:D-alanyl-D-alanine carboxypeptidase/D-alanyl-D-alanine-endopeptidase n=1 Tax=Aurantibrevibacter litoralis TaxID=3106030 RepID=UPI002AFEC256|nr:D-alanyl-D-alanine carboxypeptidase [Arenibacter sp. GZD-96]MEA1786036.1 D-alanyl-D-alanine carboxypeptidase [Arenibacter sp. GZD-96]
MQKYVVIFIFTTTLIACSSARYAPFQKNLQTRLEDPFYDSQFVGLLVYDPINQDTLYQKNAQKYFTPASNTKIFTLYTALTLLPEKLPSLKYFLASDTLFIEGTGDPTLLHPYFKDSTVIHFLKGRKEPITYLLPRIPIAHFGSGWAWEDYDSYYAPERSAFPMYGNVVQIAKSDSLIVTPNYFKDKIVPVANKKNRDLHHNVFYVDPSRNDTLYVPFMVNDTVTKNLLDYVLQKKIAFGTQSTNPQKTIIYSVPTDTVLKHMMLESDNFLAEQLLLVASSTLSDTLDVYTAQQHVLQNHLGDLTEVPRWVDGSGLSRYNLFSPGSMVHVLARLYKEIPHHRLFNLFPVGGVSGTLKNWNDFNSEPYLFAKSGSLGNTYCLSGYLITKSGKTLVFSFMNNHYKTPTVEIKARMQDILHSIRDGN